MSAAVVRMNLLRESERLSSSPVRVRVMLPVLALLLCVGAAVWWAMLFMQMLILKGEVSSAQNQLSARHSAHSAILSEMERARNLRAELDQLQFYSAGRREWGPFFAKLADIMPVDVQLVSLTVPEAAPQNLKNPINPKGPPLLGPTDPVEPLGLRILGRTKRAAPVTALMDTLSGGEFAKWLVSDKTSAATQSPKVHSFKQEAAAKEEDRLLAFDIEFRCPERRFAK